MHITEEMLGRLDRLAELETTDGERTRTIGGLEEMIAYVEQIGEVDTTGVDPLIQPFGDDELPFREDVETETDGGAGLRRNAPVQRDGMVVTPASIRRD